LDYHADSLLKTSILQFKLHPLGIQECITSKIQMSLTSGFHDYITIINKIQSKNTLKLKRDISVYMKFSQLSHSSI
jgi:hypothetical protein